METTPKNKLGTQPVGTLLKNFAIPSIVAMIVSALYNLVDQFFIGHSIGALGNAATNVAFPLTTSCTAIALLLGIGGASAFNLAMGRGERDDAPYYIGNAAVLLFSGGVALCILAELLLTPMLVFFGSPANVLPYAQDYVRIVAFGFPFLILSNGGAHLIRADGAPRLAMLCNLSGAAINTVLDPLFIFGFGMGMKGAALATILGQLFSGLWALRCLCRYKTVHLGLIHLRPRRHIMAVVASLGMSSCFNQLAMMIVQIVMNNSLTYYGALSQYGDSVPLACAGVITKVSMLFFSVCIGVAQGMQPIASFNYGARNYDRVRKVYFLAIRATLAICILAFLLFQIFPRQIIGLFGSGSEEYFRFAVRYFRIYLFFTFLNCIQPISSTFFTAIGKATKGVFLSLTRQILFLLPLIVILPRFLGIDGIMYAGPIADFAAAVAAVVMVIAEMKLMKKQEEAEAVRA